MKNKLGQYYTEERFSQLLIDTLTTENPQSVLDLGTGKGSLIKCALEKWRETKIIGIDIDKGNVKFIKDEFPSVDILLVDGLSRKLSKSLNLEINSVDLAICNPPYFNVKKNEFIKGLIDNSLLGNPDKYKRITADLVFLANNLVYLKNGGELGIILPDALITSHEFKIFRESILLNHTIQAVIELPVNSFSKTEAKTYILIVKKGNEFKGDYPVKLMESNDHGEINQEIIISSINLAERMDFKYHSWTRKKNLKGKMICEMNVEIKRGRHSKKQLQNIGVPFIHTTEIISSESLYISADINHNSYNGVYAEKGDLVMTRVGRSGLGSIALITQGRILISDCVFRIRGAQHVIDKLLIEFTSENGQNWIKANSRGVCAKIISITDLKSFRFESL